MMAMKMMMIIMMNMMSMMMTVAVMMMMMMMMTTMMSMSLGFAQYRVAFLKSRSFRCFRSVQHSTQVVRGV